MEHNPQDNNPPALDQVCTGYDRQHLIATPPQSHTGHPAWGLAPQLQNGYKPHAHPLSGMDPMQFHASNYGAMQPVAGGGGTWPSPHPHPQFMAAAAAAAAQVATAAAQHTQPLPAAQAAADDSTNTSPPSPAPEVQEITFRKLTKSPSKHPVNPLMQSKPVVVLPAAPPGLTIAATTGEAGPAHFPPYPGHGRSAAFSEALGTQSGPASTDSSMAGSPPRSSSTELDELHDDNSLSDSQRFRGGLTSPLRRRASLLLSPTRGNRMPSFTDRMANDEEPNPNFGNDANSDDDNNEEEKKQRETVDLSTLPFASGALVEGSAAWMAEVMWAPPTTLDTTKVTAFLQDMHCLLPHDRGNHSQELCLAILVSTEYSIVEAKALLATIPANRSDGRQTLFMTWCIDEMERFEKQFLKTPKNFSKIAKKVKTKRVSQCVDFYYRWKKTERSFKILTAVQNEYEPLLEEMPITWQDVTDSKSSTEFDLVEPGSGPGFVSPSQFLRPAQAAAASIAMAQIRAEANAAKPVRKEKPLDQRAAEKAKQSDLKRKREKSTKSNKHKVSGGKGSDEVDSESEEEVHELSRPEAGVFIVESILASRTPKGKASEYLVHWEGFPHSENTWEPEANLVNNVLLKAFLKLQRIKAAKEHVPAGVSAWGPLSAKHGVAKESGLALGAKRQKLANTEPPRKSHKKKFPEAPQTKQKSQHSNSTQQKVDLDPNELIKLPNQQTTSAPSIASSPTPTNSNAPVALVWASYDSGHQVEDTDFTRRLPCPFSKCNTFHCGFDELEHHLRKNHVLEKTCLCGRAFISDSSLVQHFKDNVVLDLVNSRSAKMFYCLPGNS